MSKLGFSGVLDRGPLTWFNQVNGYLQSFAKQAGHIELVRFMGSTSVAYGVKGWPVALNVPVWTTETDITAKHLDLEEPLPQVGYALASNRQSFLGLLYDPCPGRERFARVITHGCFIPLTHSEAHMTPAYLPTVVGPLTSVNTGGAPVGYFLRSASPTDVRGLGIYLNP